MDSISPGYALPKSPWSVEFKKVLKSSKEEKKAFVKKMMNIINLLEAERLADLEKPKTKRVPTFTPGLDIEAASKMMRAVASRLDPTSAFEVINEITADLQTRITALEDVLKKQKPEQKG